jgi:hypothetical protein
MKKTSSRDATAVAGRTADAGPRLGVPLFPDIEPLANVDPRDGAANGSQDRADRQRHGAGHLDQANAGPTFDSARIAYPGIGLAIYAMTPGEGVTLEVHSEGEVYRFDAATAEEALLLAFPPQAAPDVLG